MRGIAGDGVGMEDSSRTTTHFLLSLVLANVALVVAKLCTADGFVDLIAFFVVPFSLLAAGIAGLIAAVEMQKNASKPQAPRAPQ